MKKAKIVFTIHVIETIHLLWKDRKMVFIYALAGIVLGLIIAFSIPNTYKTTVILAPEESNKGFSGGISSLAAMVGMNINMNMSGDAIYPEIYPIVLTNSDFIVSLFDVLVSTEKGDYRADYATYLSTHKRISWWNYPMVWLSMGINALKGEPVKFNAEETVNPFRLTKPQWKMAKDISNAITCQVDKKTNVITLSFKDQDPYISACMVDTIQHRLQTLITDYRTHKARTDVEYLERILIEAQSNYEQAERIYALYADSHKNTNTEFVIQESRRLKGDMELQAQVYSGVAQQLQLAKAKVQECTPAFATLQSASVPVRKSNMSKMTILVIWMSIGFFARCCVLIWKNREMFYA